MGEKADKITKEETLAIAELYDSIMVSMRNNKIKDHYHIWDSLTAYFKSREPKFQHVSSMPLPNDWQFKTNIKGITYDGSN